MKPTSDPNEKDPTLIAINLDAERRREIEEVKRNFEEFYREEVRFQAEMKNSMNLVSEQQKSLRDRFEQGTARTLKELKDGFDKFLIEWGTKKEQDKTRDRRLDNIERNNSWVFRGVMLVVLTYLIVQALRTFGALQ